MLSLENWGGGHPGIFIWLCRDLCTLYVMWVWVSSPFVICTAFRFRVSRTVHVHKLIAFDSKTNLYMQTKA